MKKYLLLITLIIQFASSAQKFYAVKQESYPLFGNSIYELNLLNCDTPKINACYNVDMFSDIALDKNDNLYSVTYYGSLYKNHVNDTSTCEILGYFGNEINALVVDSSGIVYAVGNHDYRCTLYKYDSGVFTTLGILPYCITSAGDLFFYEHHLFLTSGNGALIEVNLSDPFNSCHYMDIGNTAYSAFSTRNGDSSNAYLILNNGSSSSSLVEIDIPNHSVGPVICNYPFIINGTATYYDLTSTNSTCSEPLTWKPTTTPSGTVTICEGDSVTLTVCDADWYQWNLYTDGWFASTVGVAQSITVSDTGIYRVYFGKSECSAIADDIVVTFMNPEDCLNGIHELSNASFADEIYLFPNPTSGDFMLNATNLANGYYSIILKNMIGQTFVTERVFVENNSLQKQFSISDLAMGIYSLIIENEKTNIVWNAKVSMTGNSNLH